MEQVLANLLLANPHAFSIRTQKAAALFPASQQGFNSRDVAALALLFSVGCRALQGGG